MFDALAANVGVVAIAIYQLLTLLVIAIDVIRTIAFLSCLDYTNNSE